MLAYPLPEIKEDKADGHIAALYNDIRAVIGVPIVNLIFRYMATVPGCLEWTWETLRPLYISGYIPDAADVLTADVLPGQSADLSGPISKAALTPDDIIAIDRVLNSYGRANPMNAVGLQVINLALDHEPQSESVGYALSLTDDDLLSPSGLADLLPMIDPSTAPERVHNALQRLARQVHGGDTDVIPSLFRHFGAWPVFLEQLESALAPVLSDGIESAAMRMLEESKDHAHTLYMNLTLPETQPDGSTVAALKKLIGQFPANICRMTVLATLLKRGLPS